MHSTVAISIMRPGISCVVVQIADLRAQADMSLRNAALLSTQNKMVRSTELSALTKLEVTTHVADNKLHPSVIVHLAIQWSPVDWAVWMQEELKSVEALSQQLETDCNSSCILMNSYKHQATDSDHMLQTIQNLQSELSTSQEQVTVLAAQLVAAEQSQQSVQKLEAVVTALEVQLEAAAAKATVEKAALQAELQEAVDRVEKLQTAVSHAEVGQQDAVRAAEQSIQYKLEIAQSELALAKEAAATDIKRLEQLEAARAKLEDELAKAQTEQTQKQKQREEAAGAEIKRLIELLKTAEQCQLEQSTAIDNLHTSRQSDGDKIEELEKEVLSLQQQLLSKARDIDQMMQQIVKVEHEKTIVQENALCFEQQLQEQASVNSSSQQKEMNAAVASLEARLESAVKLADAEKAQLEAQLQAAEQQAAAKHEELQDLRANYKREEFASRDELLRVEGEKKLLESEIEQLTNAKACRCID